MCELARTSDAVIALRAVMCFPLRTLRADSVRASQSFCRFFAAVLAHLAAGADGDAVFAFSAFPAETGAVGAVFPAVCAEVVRAVAAVAAIPAHTVGAVDADAAALDAVFVTPAALEAVWEPATDEAI